MPPSKPSRIRQDALKILEEYPGADITEKILSMHGRVQRLQGMVDAFKMIAPDKTEKAESKKKSR